MSVVRRGPRAERARYWQELIEEHSRSGKSVIEFCKERKLAAASFYQWRTKLEEHAKPNVPTLVPVKVVTNTEQISSARRSCIQVFTPSGVSLTVSSGAGEEELVKLLRAIDAFEASRSC